MDAMFIKNVRKRDYKMKKIQRIMYVNHVYKEC